MANALSFITVSILTLIATFFMVMLLWDASFENNFKRKYFDSFLTPSNEKYVKVSKFHFNLLKHMSMDGRNTYKTYTLRANGKDTPCELIYLHVSGFFRHILGL